MKIIASSLGLSLWHSLTSSLVFAFQFPEVDFTFLDYPQNTVFYHETTSARFRMSYKDLKYFQEWNLSPFVSLQVDGGQCPPFEYRWLDWPGYNYCDFRVVIEGSQLGQTILSNITYHLYGEKHNILRPKWDLHYSLPSFSVTVIPHPLSLSSVPIQSATAHIPFDLNLKPYVNYYLENAQAGTPAMGIMTPMEQDGLRFDPSSFSIVGSPNRTGFYSFLFMVQNRSGVSTPVDITINVLVNPKDKPVFKKDYYIARAQPGKQYRLNLLELIEPQADSMANNSLHFRIDPNQRSPEWLRVSEDDESNLVGMVPAFEAGQERETTVIASSNSGGDSQPLTLKIPVVADRLKKPSIQAIELNGIAGTYFREDLINYIHEPAHDPTLRLIIDRVSPEAPWLGVSANRPTVIEGLIPERVVGETYQIIVRANTIMGGCSDPINIPLNIAIDPELIPRFKTFKPQLPLMYVGQAFFYDFSTYQDVVPEFEVEPYTIRYAAGNHPDWLRFDGAKLIADKIPQEVEDRIEIDLIIHNKSGGDSPIYTLDLNVVK